MEGGCPHSSGVPSHQGLASHQQHRRPPLGRHLVCPLCVGRSGEAGHQAVWATRGLPSHLSILAGVQPASQPPASQPARHAPGSPTTHGLLLPQTILPQVTNDNKREYVNLVARHRMTTAIRAQIEAFLKVGGRQPVVFLFPSFCFTTMNDYLVHQSSHILQGGWAAAFAAVVGSLSRCGRIPHAVAAFDAVGASPAQCRGSIGWLSACAPPAVVALLACKQAAAGSPVQGFWEIVPRKLISISRFLFFSCCRASGRLCRASSSPSSTTTSWSCSSQACLRSTWTTCAHTPTTRVSY